jgi:hypothetical protein
LKAKNQGRNIMRIIKLNELEFEFTLKIKGEKVTYKASSESEGIKIAGLMLAE